MNRTNSLGSRFRGNDKSQNESGRTLRLARGVGG